MTAHDQGNVHGDAAGLGLAWAEELRSRFSMEGRSIAGGLPATLSDARVFVSARTRTALGPRHLAPGQADDLVRHVYAIARAHWASWTVFRGV